MSTNPTPRGHDPVQATVASAIPLGDALLTSARVAGSMCGRSEASWWRDRAADRIPAPVKLGGRTLWRVEEIRRWVEAGCPPRRTWDALQGSKKGGRQ